MGPTPILEMAHAYGLRPWLWLLDRSIKTLPCFHTKKGGLWKTYSLEQSFEGQSLLILTNRSRVWPVNYLNHQLHMCCQNWPGLTWTPRPYRHTVLTLSRCLAWISHDKFNIKPMVGTCRKTTISAPELETSRHKRWEQKLTQEIRKQQKIFYHPHVYAKNVGPCNFFVFVPLFPNLFDVPLFLTIFLLCSRVPSPNFPCFLVPHKPLGDPHKSANKQQQQCLFYSKYLKHI